MTARSPEELDRLFSTALNAGDIALMTGKWTLVGTGADGNPVQMTGQSAEVARRQPDGRWLFVVDAPWGLESEAAGTA